MARPPHPVHVLSAEQRALVDSLELYIEGMLGSHEPGPNPFIFPLPVSPAAAVAAELRRRYLAAGWSSVTVGVRPGTEDPFIRLEAAVDVLLARGCE